MSASWLKVDPAPLRALALELRQVSRMTKRAADDIRKSAANLEQKMKAEKDKEDG